MKLSQLFENVDKEKVFEALFYLYPDQTKNKAGYELSWAKIKTLKPDANVAMSCALNFIYFDDFQKMFYPEVTGWLGNKYWAIENYDWTKWLGMDIVTFGEKIEVLKPEEMAAHCLYEMTWSGFDGLSAPKEDGAVVIGIFAKIDKKDRGFWNTFDTAKTTIYHVILGNGDKIEVNYEAKYNNIKEDFEHSYFLYVNGKLKKEFDTYKNAKSFINFNYETEKS